VDRCTEYARAVVDGTILAGIDQKNACKRHLSDLERQNTEGFAYYFDADKANKIIDFAEMLQIAEGMTVENLHLMPFQCFILGSLFGWYNDKGFRKYRISYIEMARQNGKSFINGVEATYIGGFGGYKYGQMYCCATKHAQSMIVWKEIAKFINSDSDLAELFGVKEYNSLIKCLDTNCTIEALSRDRQTLDGFRAIWASLDEVHQHKDNSIYKSIVNGTGSLDETLISMITTAGFDLNSFCYEMHEYAQNVASGIVKDETFFSCVFSLDKDDDYYDSNNYIKSNPRLGATDKGIETLEDDAKRAKEMGGFELRDFLTKRLNVWVQKSDNQYIDVEAFRGCGSNRTLEDFRGQPCYVGLDLSSGGDLTTLNLEFPFTYAGRQKYYFYSHSFMPRARLQEHIQTDIAPYDIWERDGLITVTGGLMDFKNDYKYIVKHLKDLQEEYGFEYLGVGYDPHNADGFLADLEELGCPLTMITQSARFLNDATVDLQLLIKNGDMEYNKGSELFVWSFINAKIVSNSFGEIKVDKEPNAKNRRIDPVDAAIDSHILSIKQDTDIDIDGEMQKYLERMGWN